MYENENGATTDPILLCTTKRQRLVAYSLIGGQTFINYLPRLAVPFIVPYMAHEFGWTDLQRSGLLSVVAPGYVLTMIPGAILTSQTSPKELMLINNIATVAVLTVRSLSPVGEYMPALD